MEELKLAPIAGLSASAPADRRNSAMHTYAPLTLVVVEDYVEWNGEAATRCDLLTADEVVNLYSNPGEFITSECCHYNFLVLYFTSRISRNSATTVKSIYLESNML